MKVRVIERPEGNGYWVEQREWVALVFPVWTNRETFHIHGHLPPHVASEEEVQAARNKAKALAIEYAKRLKNPEVIEV